MANDVYVRAVKFQLPSVTGSFDITCDLGGKTPKERYALADEQIPARIRV